MHYKTEQEFIKNILYKSKGQKQPVSERTEYARQQNVRKRIFGKEQDLRKFQISHQVTAVFK